LALKTQVCREAYRRAIDKAFKILGADAPEDCLRLSVEEWRKAQDPSLVAQRVYEYVQQNSDAQQRHASMTVQPRGHVLLEHLQNFQEDSDRVVVLNLLCSVAGFCFDGFRGIKKKSDGEVKTLAQSLEAESASNYKINLNEKGLFACDVDAVLQAMLQLPAMTKDMQTAEITIRLVQDV
jgi:hypothetical protein